MSKAVSRGQALQIAARVATQVKWDELDGDQIQEEIINLSPEEFGKKFTVFLNQGCMMAINLIHSTFRYDKSKDDWKLLENTPRRLTSANIEGISFLKGTESQINGEEMVRRATGLDANLGQEDAEFLLEHQDEIPAELREFYLVFPGTMWQGSGEDRFVPFLSWVGGQWVLCFFWLGSGWVSFGRFVRPRK